MSGTPPRPREPARRDRVLDELGSRTSIDHGFGNSLLEIVESFGTLLEFKSFW